MEFKIGQKVDYKSDLYDFVSCNVIGYNKNDNTYIVQIFKNGKRGWTTDSSHRGCGAREGIEGCIWAFESELTPYKPTNRGKNPRGKDGKFTKQPTLEARVSALEEKMRKIQEA